MRLRIFITLIFAALLTGCATGKWKLPSYDELSPEKSGVAIATVGNDNWPKGARIYISFRPISSPETYGEFVYLQNSLFFNMPLDIQEGSITATVSTHRLPPGKYEIYEGTVMIGLGAMQIYYWDKRPFSFPFEIKEGKATYLGEFIARSVSDGSKSGLVFSVRNQQPRDLELLKKRGLQFSPGDTTNAVMSKEQSANSIFKRIGDPP